MEHETHDQYLERVRIQILLAGRVWQAAINAASAIAQSSQHNINVVDLAQRILDESRRDG